MSVSFSPMNIGNTQVKNRFVRSATYECMAKESGEITDELVNLYRHLARGEVGLLITGYTFIHSLGRAYKYQAGIHNDGMIPGLKRMVDAVHRERAKIVLQLGHAGRQTTKALVGKTPIGPSSMGRDPINFVKPRQMSEEDIQAAITSFGHAARRAREAGADGVQLHGAHGYLINQFLSPFFNHRVDTWGGTDEHRFRFLKETVLEVKHAIGDGMIILVKLNTNDFTPQEGITPSLAVKYAGWLAELGIDGVEISCGTILYSFMNMSRGEVPVDELLSGLPWWKKPLARLMLHKLVGKYDLEEGYNLEAAKLIKPVLGDVPLILVGGLRNPRHMEEVLGGKWADLISMSRPFIREPYLVKRLREGKAEVASCVSCNRCLAAINNNMPLRCYYKGSPSA
jgi:2,4-dienoyl-CoA reductase-like NADH-dependent reductase (Old Yellow Enzyme family)